MQRAPPEPHERQQEQQEDERPDDAIGRARRPPARRTRLALRARVRLLVGDARQGQ